MGCNDCTFAKTSLDSISVAAHETAMAREDKKNKRLIWLIVLLVVALLATNIAWLLVFNSYELEVETVEYEQDGDGINIIGDHNRANQYEPETQSNP